MPQDALTRQSQTKLTSAIFERVATSEGSSSIYVLWAFFTFASVIAAVAVCFTPGADKRFSTAMNAPERRAQPQPSVSTVRLDPAPAASPAEDDLTVRLKALEDQIGNLTGSIPSSTSTQPGTPAMAAPAGVTPTAGSEPRQVRTASVPAPGAIPEPAAIHTSFGVDLGAEASFGALRTRWDGLKRQYPELASLSPLISVRDKNGKLELRLIAGPFENAADAARACSGLLSKGMLCDGGLFEGQRLPAS